MKWTEEKKARTKDPSTDKRSRAHTSSCSVGTGVVSLWLFSRGVQLSPNRHLPPWLRTGGVIPLLPLYAFVA